MYTSIRFTRRVVCSAVLMLACAFPLMSKGAQAQTDVLTFTAVTHNFGTAAPNGAPVNFGVKVQNTSQATNYVNFGVTLSGSSEFTTVNNCPASIAPSGTCEILFIFTPSSSLGTATATWNVTSGGQNPTFVYAPTLPGTLTGTVVNSAGLTLSTAGHNFGTQLAYTTGTTYGIVLTNSTSDPVQLSIDLTPSGYQNFPYLHTAYTCPTILAAGQACNLQWQFFPSAGNGSSGQPTPFSAMFGISGRDTITGQNVIVTAPPYSGNTPTQVLGVTLSGYGITGTNYLLMSTSTHNFGSVKSGSASSTYGIQLINTTNVAVTVTVAESGNYGAFPINNDNCFKPSQFSTTLASGQSCQVQFYFQAPSQTGVTTGNYGLTATSSNGTVLIIDQSTSQRVSGATLTGNSVSQTLTVDSSGKNFGPWVVGTTSSPYAATISYPKCTGPGCTQDPVNLSFAYSSGSNTGDFNLLSNTCPSQITAGGSCTITWTFSPQSAGAFGATYNITALDATTGQPVNVIQGSTPISGIVLSGNGQANAELALATSSHNFGEQGVGGSSATYGTVLYNTTGSTVTLAFGTTTANFPLVVNNCPANMPTNTSCNIQYKFSPQTTGPLAAFISITATTYGQPVTIIDLSTNNPVNPPGLSLSGTGVN